MEQGFDEPRRQHLIDPGALDVRIEEAREDSYRSKDVFYELLNWQLEDIDIQRFKKYCEVGVITIVGMDLKFKPDQWPTFEVMERTDGKKHIAVVIPAQWHLLINEENEIGAAAQHVGGLARAVVDRYEELAYTGTKFMNGKEFAEFLVTLSRGRLERK